jgi:hypothetical protein
MEAVKPVGQFAMYAKQPEARPVRTAKSMALNISRKLIVPGKLEERHQIDQAISARRQKEAEEKRRQRKANRAKKKARRK